MALANQLPVYKASYDLMVNLCKHIKHFHREYKYTLGERLQNETIDLITNVYRANSSRDKKEWLESARANAEIIRLYLRLSKDLQQFSLANFVDCNQQLESVSKQLTGWYISTLKKN